jgi:hypothetical protein
MGAKVQTLELLLLLPLPSLGSLILRIMLCVLGAGHTIYSFAGFGFLFAKTFLRESASATAVPGAPRSPATPTKTKSSRRAGSISSPQFRHRICGVWSFTPLHAKKPLNRRWSPPVGGSPIIGRRVGVVDIISLSGQHLSNAILVRILSQMISRAEPAVAASLTLAEAAKPHVTAVILYIHVTLRGALRVLVGVAPVLGRIRCMGRRA